MFIKLNKVIIAQDLTGMILAPMLGAVFIPVSYLPPFGWEYIDFNAPIISDFKFLLKKDEKYEKDNLQRNKTTSLSLSTTAEGNSKIITVEDVKLLLVKLKLIHDPKSLIVVGDGLSS